MCTHTTYSVSFSVTFFFPSNNQVSALLRVRRYRSHSLNKYYLLFVITSCRLLLFCTPAPYLVSLSVTLSFHSLTRFPLCSVCIGSDYIASASIFFCLSSTNFSSPLVLHACYLLSWFFRDMRWRPRAQSSGLGHPGSVLLFSPRPSARETEILLLPPRFWRVWRGCTYLVKNNSHYCYFAQPPGRSTM